MTVHSKFLKYREWGTMTSWSSDDTHSCLAVQQFSQTEDNASIYAEQVADRSTGPSFPGVDGVRRSTGIRLDCLFTEDHCKMQQQASEINPWWRRKIISEFRPSNKSNPNFPEFPSKIYYLGKIIEQKDTEVSQEPAWLLTCAVFRDKYWI